MRKAVAVAVAVCVMCAAGTAFAQRGNQDSRKQLPPQRMERPESFRGQEAPRPQNMSGDFRGPHGDFRPDFGGQHCGFEGMRPRGPMFTPDMPKEIREKAVELAKLRVDLEEAMTSRPLNKEKALEVHGKMQKVEQEIEAWRFAQRLERIEVMQKQHELNKNVPPAKQKTPEVQEQKPAE